MQGWVLSTPLEGLVQNAPRKELEIAPVVECCITNKLALSRAMDTLLKNQISIDVFMIEDYEYAALRKKFLISPFVFWESLTDNFC